MGTSTGWCDKLRVGNPVRTDLTNGVHVVRIKASGCVSKTSAPAPLRNHQVEPIGAPMHQQRKATTDQTQKVIPSRNISVLMVAFSTMTRGDELTRTLV